jgi:hypothetical protein
MSWQTASIVARECHGQKVCAVCQLFPRWSRLVWAQEGPATFGDHDNPGLQNQMGHATRATTDRYRRWAGGQLAAHQPDLPAAVDGAKQGTKQRGNAGKDDGRPVLRVVSA